MAKTAEDIVRESLASLLGRKVSSASLAANSLIVDIETQPDEHSELWLWCEPTWHIVSPEGSALGSRQAQVEGKQHNEIGQLAAQLDGCTIERLDVDQHTRDILIHLSGGYCVRTFVLTRMTKKSGTSVTRGRGLAMGASPRQFFVREVEPLAHPTSG